MNKDLSSKTWIAILIIAVVLIGIYIYSIYPKEIPVTQPPIEPPTDTRPKNPTISNLANDLVGNNNLEGIGLGWDRDDRAAGYVLFRSESISGPFVDLGSVGSARSTNASDFTPDAQTKTLCYKIEARDSSGKTIRVYEPVCVPKWQE